ncbi:hypothetical protein V8C26DRAFT_272077 [Trichoderma gracile]
MFLCTSGCFLERRKRQTKRNTRSGRRHSGAQHCIDSSKNKHSSHWIKVFFSPLVIFRPVDNDFTKLDLTGPLAVRHKEKAKPSNQTRSHLAVSLPSEALECGVVSNMRNEACTGELTYSNRMQPAEYARRCIRTPGVGATDGSRVIPNESPKVAGNGFVCPWRVPWGKMCFDAGLNREVKQQQQQQKEEVEPTMPLDDWSKGQADKNHDAQLGLQRILG